jgi:hypothetical protein
MKHLAANVFFTLILIITGLASIYGVLISERSPVLAIGSMQLAPFSSGFALFQENRPYYFSFSPYNDYIVTDDNSKSALITKAEVDAKSFTTDLHILKILDIQNNLLNYFNLDHPNLTFSTSNYQFTYRVEAKNNKLILSRNLQIKNNIIPKLVGSTVNYFGTDFVYDQSGRLYVFKQPEDITWFSQFYGVNLTYEQGEDRIMIPGKVVTIVNPSVAGAIVIRARDNQNLFVDRPAHLIEIEDPVVKVGDNITTSMNIEIYD